MVRPFVLVIAAGGIAALAFFVLRAQGPARPKTQVSDQGLVLPPTSYDVPNGGGSGTDRPVVELTTRQKQLFSGATVTPEPAPVPRELTTLQKRLFSGATIQPEPEGPVQLTTDQKRLLAGV